jgi:hypothetical protein
MDRRITLGETNGHEHAGHRFDRSHWDLNVLDLVRQWDLGSSRWGLLGGFWAEVTLDMGLIVARDNREVLTFHQVEGLILFTQHELMAPLKQLLKAEAQGVRLSNEPSKAEQPDEVYKTIFTVLRNGGGNDLLRSISCQGSSRSSLRSSGRRSWQK